MSNVTPQCIDFSVDTADNQTLCGQVWLSEHVLDRCLSGTKSSDVLNACHLQWLCNESRSVSVVKKPPPPIIGLHGWLDNSSTWCGLAPLFIEQEPNRVMICMDFAGHGKSSHKHAQARYDAYAYCNDVMQFIQVLFPNQPLLSRRESDQSKADFQFSLFSHSLGAGVATRVAGLFPEYIESLFLVESLGASSSTAEQNVKRVRSMIARNTYMLERKARPYKSFDEAVDRIVKTNPHIARQSVETMLKRGLVLKGDSYYFRHDGRLTGTTPHQSEEEVQALIKRIDCPVLLVWAEKRFYTLSTSLVEERQKLIDAQKLMVVNLPGTGHHVHIDQPKLVFEYVKKFFTKYGLT